MVEAVLGYFPLPAIALKLAANIILSMVVLIVLAWFIHNIIMKYFKDSWIAKNIKDIDLYFLCSEKRSPTSQRPSLLSYFILIALVITFGGFAYMHYQTVLPQTTQSVNINGTEQKIKPQEPDILTRHDQATGRVFSLVTVLIAAATLIVALQFIVNTRMLRELELKSKNFEKDFKGKESKLARIESAINKVESLAQATSYPLHINMQNIDQTSFSEIPEYGKWITHSFDGFNNDNLKDKADWNRILFLAKQARALQPENNAARQLVAIAACKAEECTGNREEKSILLTLAIETFESMAKEEEPLELSDKVNLASVYARRGGLYAYLPRSDDYKQADRLFDKAVKRGFCKEDKEIARNAFFNWGLSWLARASIFDRDPEKWGQDSFREAKHSAENYLKKANEQSELSVHMADYALLTLYSISRDKKQCEIVIDGLEKEFNASDESVPLPKLHRIIEDIDLNFIKNEDKNLYDRLFKLTEENDNRDRIKKSNANSVESDMEA